MHARLAAILLALVLPSWIGAGCASRPPTPRADPKPGTSRIVIPAADYAQAFEAARLELVRLRYTIDRADAQAGIIQTMPASGAGLLAPWTMGPGARVVEDTLNRQGRLVEVRFEPAQTLDRAPQGPAALANPDAPAGPLQAQGSIVVSVRVLVLRRVTPTRRLEPSAIRLSTNPIKPELFVRGLSGQFHAPTDLDPDAARTLAGNLEKRLLEATRRGHAHGRAPNQSGPAVDAQLPVQ